MKRDEPLPDFWPRFALLVAGFLAAGCTSPLDYLRNGFKVGPNYQPPSAPVAAAYIEISNPLVNATSPDLRAWWSVFGDPTLNDLVQTAFAQNINLRIAASRVLEARAQLGIAVGELFPQQQTASGSYAHFQASKNI